MQAWTGLYRKYRFDNFDKIRGQHHVVQSLKNAILENKVASAYLFSGTRGTGKTSMARLLTKAINCLNRKENEYNPCGECDNCKAISKGVFPGLIELDAASNRGIDDIRNLITGVAHLPVGNVKYKVYVIDEAHMLTKEAANALLKTLEEPPSYVKFILATTEPVKILPTIRSRTLHFEFKKLTVEEIFDYLNYVVESESKIEPKEIENEALKKIAKFADGAMRDALAALEQVVAFSGDKITSNDVDRVLGLHWLNILEEFQKILIDKNIEKAIEIVNQIRESGLELFTFFEEFFKNNDNLFLNLEFEKLDKMYNLLFNLKYSNEPLIEAKMLVKLICEKETTSITSKENNEKIETVKPKQTKIQKNTSEIKNTEINPPEKKEAEATNKPQKSITNSQKNSSSKEILEAFLSKVKSTSMILWAAIKSVAKFEDNKIILAYSPKSIKIYEKTVKNEEDKLKKVAEELGIPLEIVLEGDENSKKRKILQIFGDKLKPIDYNDLPHKVKMIFSKESEDVVPF